MVWRREGMIERHWKRKRKRKRWSEVEEEVSRQTGKRRERKREWEERVQEKSKGKKDVEDDGRTWDKQDKKNRQMERFGMHAQAEPYFDTSMDAKWGNSSSLPCLNPKP